MARQKTAEPKPVGEPAGEYVPSWQRDSVDRSLRNAIERARKRSDRFVDAAIELLSERDEGDFSIQDVVDQGDAAGVHRPLHFVRVGSETYYRKGGRR